MPPYPSISDPDQFDNWRENFKQTAYGVTYSKEAKEHKAKAIKTSINNILNEISGIPVQRRSTETLELNLLYACFMATRTPAPELDAYAETRKELAAEKESRASAVKSLSSIQNYIDDHRAIALKAIAQTDDPLVKVAPQPTNLSAHRLESLEKLLIDFEHGLMEFQDDPNHLALISSADFRYGPFEFDFDLNSEWKHKGTKLKDEGMNMIHTGLMFHLTYLFRYFTGETLPKTAAFFSGDILVLDGVRMIYCGKPYGQHVAALINAVFNEKYPSIAVKNNLDALYKPTPGSKITKNPLFVGW
jgi:hypothetical protein